MDQLEVQEYLTQGAVLSGQEKYEEALRYYRKAEAADPMNLEVYLSQGIACANLNRLEEAKTQFRKALKIDRSSGQAHFHLGSIAILEGDIAKGFEEYNQAVSSGYDNAQIYYSIGLLHEENGDIDMAIRNYSKAISRDALRPDIRVRKARLLIQGGHYPEAVQALDEMILTNPDVFEGYHLKFTTLMQLGKLEEAEKTLADATALFPKDPAFVFDRVALLAEQKRLDQALALLEELEGGEETDRSVLHRICMERAQLCAANDRLDGAIEALEQARSLSGEEGEFDQEALFLLANCYLAKERYDLVLDFARQLLEKGEEGYIKETARYFRPFALKKLGRMEEALPLYEEAVREYRSQSLAAPGNLDAYLLRIMCLRDMEKYEKALELADYVAELQPERAEPRLLRVTVLEAMGRKEEAEEEAERLRALLPEELLRKAGGA